MVFTGVGATRSLIAVVISIFHSLVENPELSSEQQIVYLVDDDPDIRALMSLTLQKFDVPFEEYDSAESFLEHYDSNQPGCVLLDIGMPGMSGLDLQRTLTERGQSIPIVFLTGKASIPLTVQAMKEGAIDFLEKPSEPEILLDRIQQAFAEDTRRREEQRDRTELQQRVSLLTFRERDVFKLLVSEPAGMSSKSIANRLKISPRTVEHHRARITEKLQARSIAELIKVAELVGETTVQATFGDFGLRSHTS